MSIRGRVLQYGTHFTLSVLVKPIFNTQMIRTFILEPHYLPQQPVNTYLNKKIYIKKKKAFNAPRQLSHLTRPVLQVRTVESSKLGQMMFMQQNVLNMY